MVITFRPEFNPPWTGYTHVTSLSLSRLGRRDPLNRFQRRKRPSRQLAKKGPRGVDEPLLILSWTPGGDPFVIQTSTTHGNVSLQVSRDELPEKEWFTIRFDRS